MTGELLVIGIGNPYRRDDGVGPAVAAELAALDVPGVKVLTVLGEPTVLLETWADAALAVIVDAGVADVPSPGRVSRYGGRDPMPAVSTSTHGWSIPQAIELATLLDRAPERVVIYTVEAADTGHGEGLTPQVAAAVPDVVAAVLAEIALAERRITQGSARHR